MSAKVLVVDDSGTMRRIIVRSLNALGVFDIVEAADGDEAFAIFKNLRFDLVLTDWNMPQMSGIDLLRAIRGSCSSTPVILVTTETEKQRVIDAIQAGVSDYVVKPFDTDVLRDKLQKYIEIATV